MAGEPSPKKAVTPSEYLAIERASAERHVLWDGEIFAMAGAGRIHNLIVANVIASLHVGLRGRPCDTHASDLRIWVPAKRGYVYPDASVACDPIELQEPEKLDVLMNPRLVVEVLSESTEAFDRGAKFDGYKSIPSLEHYVLVATDRRHVDHYRRHGTEEWILRSHEENGTVTLDSLALTLRLDDVYERSEVGRVVAG